MKSWTKLAKLENEAATLLGWDAVRIAQSSESEIQDAIMQAKKSCETKQDIQENTEPFVVLSQHFPNQTFGSGVINNIALFDQLLIFYRTLSETPVNEKTIESLLFPVK